MTGVISNRTHNPNLGPVRYCRFWRCLSFTARGGRNFVPFNPLNFRGRPNTKFVQRFQKWIRSPFPQNRGKLIWHGRHLKSVQIWTDSRSGEQRGVKFAPPFWGLRKIALTPKLGRGPYKNFEVFCSGLVALLIHFPPSSPANSASRSSAATWIYVLPVVAHSLTVMGRSFPFGVRQIIMRGRRRISITRSSSSSIDTLLPPIVVDKCQVLAGWPFFLFVFSRTSPLLGHKFSQVPALFYGLRNLGFRP